MKFISLIKSEAADDKYILKEEFKTAVRAGEGRLGENHLFYRYFINVKYVSYLDIKKAYLNENYPDIEIGYKKNKQI